jgi:hypothetical protein
MSIVYCVDAHRWPAELAFLFGVADKETEWIPVADAPGRIAASVSLDFDSRDRCCGIEIWDAALITPRHAEVHGVGMSMPLQQGALLLSPENMNDQQYIYRWGKGITSFAGDGDPHLSLHWRSGRAYDYSADLEELEDGVMRWLSIGLDSDKLLVGLRVQAPNDHVRGL